MTSNVEHEFFKTSEHSSQVTRLQGFEGYMVTELQNPPYILPYLHYLANEWVIVHRNRNQSQKPGNC